MGPNILFTPVHEALIEHKMPSPTPYLTSGNNLKSFILFLKFKSEKTSIYDDQFSNLSYYEWGQIDTDIINLSYDTDNNNPFNTNLHLPKDK